MIVKPEEFMVDIENNRQNNKKDVPMSGIDY